MEQVNKLLNGLPKEFQKKWLISVSKQTAKIIGNAAVQNLSGLPGGEQLTKQIKIWQLKSPLPGAWVGWNLKQADKEYKEFQRDRSKAVWRLRGCFWLEFGTIGIQRHNRWFMRSGERTQTKAGTQYRKIEACGWWRRAVDQNINATEKEFLNRNEKKANQFFKKNIKKYGW